MRHKHSLKFLRFNSTRRYFIYECEICEDHFWYFRPYIHRVIRHGATYKELGSYFDGAR